MVRLKKNSTSGLGLREKWLHWPFWDIFCKNNWLLAIKGTHSYFVISCRLTRSSSSFLRSRGWREPASSSPACSTCFSTVDLLTKKKLFKKKKNKYYTGKVNKQFFSVKNLQSSHCKSKSATIAFFSSPPFFLLAFSFSPFLFLRWCDFRASRTRKKLFRLTLFHSNDCKFRQVAIQKIG